MISDRGRPLAEDPAADLTHWQSLGPLTLQGVAMNQQNRDSRVDALAIFFLIVIVVSTAVFWVSHQ